MLLTQPLMPNTMLSLPIVLTPNETQDAEAASPLEAAMKIFESALEIKSEIVRSQQWNIDRAVIQQRIAEKVSTMTELASIAGYSTSASLLSIDVQTDGGPDRALVVIEGSIQSAIDLVNILGGFEKPEPTPDPTPLQAVEAIIPLLLEIKVQTIGSFVQNVDLEKIQTNIEAAVHEISKLAPFAQYEGVGFLSSVNVRDKASTEAWVNQLDAEIVSVIGMAADLNQVNENQTVRGTRADDEITTGSGDDTVIAERGNDLVDTGNGDDEVKAGRGDDTVYGGADDDDLAGGRGDDLVNGGEGDDRVQGGRGNDSLTGGAGDDIVLGARGDDVLFGNLGDDYLFGGFGDDALDGGTGDDVLKGGRGADDFVFEGNLGNDTVRDFNSGEDDHLVFIFHDGAFRDWSAQSILDASSQTGRDIVIDFEGADDMVTLVDTDLATLNVNNIDVFWYV